jgi:Mn2+/Fe2+ NRAMP family transporter
VLQPLHLQASTLGEVGLAMAQPFGAIGALLFAAVLFVTCLGAALECTLSLSYIVAQGFGWAWGKNNKRISQAPRFNLMIVVFLSLAFVIGLSGFDPLQLALFASTVIALFLPISLMPFIILMNDPQYLGDKVNNRWTNSAVLIILLIAFVVALVSLPLELLSGGG